MNDDRPKARDADSTRQALLRAARTRFARDGYSATTVRDIATDAGVNVALINRYFGSKEGLFEACLERVGQELDRPPAPATPDRVARELVKQVLGYSQVDSSAQLMLLLRTSGDERVDEIRTRILLSFGQRLGRSAGWDSEGDDDRVLLGAQIVLATALGMVQLRSTTGLEPLGSASEDALEGPVRAVIAALLPDLTREA